MSRIVTCIAFVLLGVVPLFVAAQTKTLHGVIKSKITGVPLPGVTVLGATVKIYSVTDAKRRGRE